MKTKVVNVETISLEACKGQVMLGFTRRDEEVMMRFGNKVLKILSEGYHYEGTELCIARSGMTLTLTPSEALDLGFITKVEFDEAMRQKAEQRKRDQMAYERSQYEKLKAKFEGE